MKSADTYCSSKFKGGIFSWLKTSFSSDVWMCMDGLFSDSLVTMTTSSAVGAGTDGTLPSLLESTSEDGGCSVEISVDISVGFSLGFSTQHFASGFSSFIAKSSPIVWLVPSLVSKRGWRNQFLKITFTDYCYCFNDLKHISKKYFIYNHLFCFENIIFL